MIKIKKYRMKRSSGFLFPKTIEKRNFFGVLFKERSEGGEECLILGGNILTRKNKNKNYANKSISIMHKQHGGSNKKHGLKVIDQVIKAYFETEWKPFL